MWQRPFFHGGMSELQDRFDGRRVAEAIERVTGDNELRTTLKILGEDRARLFTWRASAEGVWQLHADL